MFIEVVPTTSADATPAPSETSADTLALGPSDYAIVAALLLVSGLSTKVYRNVVQSAMQTGRDDPRYRSLVAPLGLP